MVWKGEKQRHSTARRGIKTKSNMTAKGITEWNRFDIERNLYLANEEMPVGTKIHINGIEYEIRNYFLDYNHNVPTVEIFKNADKKGHREVHFVPLSIIWKNFVNYSALTQEQKSKEWDKIDTYKFKK